MFHPGTSQHRGSNSSVALQRSNGVTQALGYHDAVSARGAAKAETMQGAAWRLYRHPNSGERSLHPALQNDETYAQNKEKFQPKAQRSADHDVEDVLGFTKSAVSGLVQKIQDQREHHYASKKREPLGRCPDMSYKLPAHCTPDNYTFKGFGIQSNRSETCKDVMNAQAVLTLADEDGGDGNAVACQTGGWVDRKAGIGCQQPTRGRPQGVDLNAVGIDKTRHVFGAVPPKNDGGAAACFKAQAGSNAKSKLMPSIIEDHRESSVHQAPKHALGRSRHTTVHIDPSMTFGVSSPPKAETVMSCMKQEHLKERKCDALGTSMKRVGAIVIEPKADPNTTYGLPTIRNDVLPPRNRRTADNTNFGDEVSAISLIRDGSMIDSKTQFLRPLNKEELRGVLSRCDGLFEDVLLNDNLFNQIWKQAVAKTKIEFAKLPRGMAAGFLHQGSAPPRTSNALKVMAADNTRRRAASATPGGTLRSTTSPVQLGGEAEKASVDAFQTICAEMGV